MTDQAEKLFIAEQEQSRKKFTVIKKISKAFGYSIVFFCILLSVVIVFRLNETISPDIFPKLITAVLLVSSAPTIICVVILGQENSVYGSMVKWIAPIFIALAIGLVFWFIG